LEKNEKKNKQTKNNRMVAGWFSSRLYYPFGKGPGQHIIRCLENKKCENERESNKQQ